jgi:soluble lytic murein transglycosylase-like protein
MAFEQKDPFSWAQSYMNAMSNASAQDSSHAQNSLMAVFNEEAARQRPWSDLPVDLAKQNNQYDLALRNNVAGATMRAANKPMVPPGKIANAISSAAKRYGIDQDILLTVAELESGFRADAQNPTSSAGGVFQFIDGTWKQYGGGGDKMDANLNIDAGARFTRDNIIGLQKAGLPVNAGTVYLAHQQGLGGAIKLLSNPNAPAESIVGAKAVRLNGGRQGMSAQQFANLWMTKANRLYEPRAAQRNRNQGQKQDLNSIFGDDVVKPTTPDEEDDGVIYEITDDGNNG